MRLLSSHSALLLPAIASTQVVLASSTPATASASSTRIPIEFSAPPSSSLSFSTPNKEFLAHWSPISTIWPSQPTDSSPAHLDLRQVQVATGGAATVAGQVSPVTTLNENYKVNGVATAVEVIYTQTFAAVPDQGEAPGVGTIGLGTIQGAIGIVKTKDKRDAVPMATAMAEPQVEKREVEVEVERSLEENGGVLETAEEKKKMQQRRSSTSLAAKVDATSAGSALALLVAITAMIVV